MDDHLFFTEFVVERLDIIQVCEKAQFIFYLNGKRIAVSIFADLDDGTDDEERKSVEERMIELITAAWDPYLDFDDIEDLQLYERSVDKAAEMVMDIGRVPFSQIAPPLKQHYEYPTDLHHKLFPETFDFRLETIHDTAFMIPITSAQAAWPRNDGGPDPNFKTDFEPDPQLPRYSTKDITFVHKCREGRAQQVQIGSETMLCKAFTDGLEFDYLAPELIALQKIEVANANLEVPLRIPLLKGYVTHPTTGAILGFVRSWIPPSQYGNSLEEASSRMSSIPRHVRRKWLRQIIETIDGLHSVGLVASIRIMILG
ncbi:hypothetical protein FPOAC2_10069 [Fusarium poae]|uniref:Uncharacterized protein n=1 Tax=Fusarium poae TaxID=36050 RepID=A0A1B8AQV3_FUSPO|nr:hypothetical protein FPOA_09221 [Fusarium poae]